MTPPLTDLISRLERASGPDRDLDMAIEEAVGGRTRLLLPHCEERPYWQWTWVSCGELNRGGETVAIRPLTASLDAAMVFIEAVQPREGVAVLKTALSDFPTLGPWIDLPRWVLLTFLRSLEAA